METRAGRTRIAPLDLAIAAFLGIAFGAFYVLSHQRRLWGDGHRLFEMATGEGWRWWDTWNHVAYTPIAQLFVALGAGRTPFDDVALASSVPAAVAVAASALLARAVGCGRLASVLSAALLGLAPALAFFATVIEVHALHAAGVALALLASVLLAPRLSARGFALAHAALFLPLAATHLSAPTLGPGWLVAGVLLARAHHPALLARARGWRFAALQTLGMIAAYAAVLAIADVTAYQRHGRGSAEGVVALVKLHAAESSWAFAREEWLEPLGAALAPLVAAFAMALVATWAPAARERDAGARALIVAALAWLVLPTVFFLAWAVPNEGGYLLGSFPVLVIAVAALPRLMSTAAARAVATAVLAALVVLQAPLAAKAVRAYRAKHDALDRPARLAAVADALPDGGLLVAFDLLQQPVTIELPRVAEVELLLPVFGAVRDGESPEGVRARLVALLGERVASYRGPIVVDLDYRRHAAGDPALGALAALFEEELARMHELVPLDDARWPLARLLPRAE